MAPAFHLQWVIGQSAVGLPFLAISVKIIGEDLFAVRWHSNTLSSAAIAADAHVVPVPLHPAHGEQVSRQGKVHPIVIRTTLNFFQWGCSSVPDWTAGPEDRLGAGWVLIVSQYFAVHGIVASKS